MNGSVYIRSAPMDPYITWAASTTATATFSATSLIRAGAGSTESANSSSVLSDCATASAATRKNDSGMVVAAQAMAPNETPWTSYKDSIRG